MKRNNYFRTKKFKGNDSKEEHRRALELKLLERAGEISNLKEQVTFELQPSFKIKNGKKVRIVRPITYTSDFTYYDNKLGRDICEESKGFKTESYRLKAKIFQYKFPELMFIETGSFKKAKKKTK